MVGVAWEIDTDLIEPFLLALDKESKAQVLAALEVLADRGPQLGRPLVDTVSGSRHKNMKELRPGSSGRTEIRALFVFDPVREAIMLVAGDKSGQWSKWYRKAIPLADDLYDQHLERLKKEGR